jgi:hypothetical protein
MSFFLFLFFYELVFFFFSQAPSRFFLQLDVTVLTLIPAVPQVLRVSIIPCFSFASAVARCLFEGTWLEGDPMSQMVILPYSRNKTYKEQIIRPQRPSAVIV